MENENYCQRCGEQVIDKIPACPLQCMDPKCKAYIPPPKVDPCATPVIWVFGGPCSGKTTVCAALASKYNFQHVDVGNLLRREVKREVDESECIRHALKKGELVPPDIVASILKAELLANKDTVKGFFIDGFPRVPSQGAAFERVIAPSLSILFLAANREILSKRLQGASDPERAEFRLDFYFKHKDAIIAINHHKVEVIDASVSPDAVNKAFASTLDKVLAKREEILALDKKAGAKRF